MKKYIPLISLSLLSLTVLSCRQSDIADDPISPNYIAETSKDFSAKTEDTIRNEINPASDPPIKDTHDWRPLKNN
ncbi:hypothetical protein [Chryseobacterium gleum]|uniref:hypothetical protein n=1 Tax=Chryseobacterium gleum TaxID=250 RepID=UPI00241E0469|nr:hypothetical protein [Chryseobacterium gleum]